ncbi:MAG: hypothetical protein KDC98_22565 [Planctomycetes bacterium]|nr:hypothetical protein [Planctomycetota bacterium]
MAVFLESFLPNLALFIAGQVAAWFYLRSGRWWLGGTAMAVLWGAADWAVVARYVFADTGAGFHWAMIVMQATALTTVVALGVSQWRRRWSGVAKRRAEIYGEGMQQYLRGSYEAAAATFRRLVRNDPWDTAAWLGLGNVLRRAGHSAAARRCYRRCRSVDLTSEYRDLAKAMQASAAVVRKREERGESGERGVVAGAEERIAAQGDVPVAGAVPK